MGLLQPKIRRGLHNFSNCDVIKQRDESSLVSVMGQGSRRAALAHPASAKPGAFSLCRVVLKPHLRACCDFQSLYKISTGSLVARCCFEPLCWREGALPWHKSAVACRGWEEVNGQHSVEVAILPCVRVPIPPAPPRAGQVPNHPNPEQEVRLLKHLLSPREMFSRSSSLS